MQTFTTPAPVTAVLDVPAGRVRLVAADRADTTVEVMPADPGKGRDVKAAEQTAVEYADGVLQVATPGGNRVLGPSGAVEVTVHLPAGSQVRAVGIDLRGTGRLGEVSFQGHGDVELDQAAAVRLTTEAGDVNVARLDGSGEITTQKGGITVAEAAGGTLTLRTQAGDITVNAAAGVSASLDAGTSMGRVDNALANSGPAGLTIHATTAQGDITARSL
ncbi:DUF4097 family beta strand repeat-containing protein [Spirillospora sp. NPDC050679]